MAQLNLNLAVTNPGDFTHGASVSAKANMVFTGHLLLEMQPVILLVIAPTGYKLDSVRTAVQRLEIPHQIQYFAAVIQALSIIDAEMELASDLVILNFSMPYMHVTEAIEEASRNSLSDRHTDGSDCSRRLGSQASPPS
jgi:hypothetical protein